MKYFTIGIRDEVGFSDQLNQMFLLYHIGKLLGLEYLHSTLSSKRTSGDIWSDLMLDAQFDRLDDHAIAGAAEFLDLAVADRRVGGGRHASLNDLIATLKARIAAKASPQTILRLRLGDRNPVLSLLTSLPHSSFQGFRDRIGRAFAQTGWSGPFSSDARLRVLVHIRKGDTARIEMPWGDELALWHHDAAISPNRQPDDLAILRAIVRSLSQRFSANDIEIAVFSDGFARSRQVIDEALADDPFFGGERMALIDHILTEKEAELRLFCPDSPNPMLCGRGIRQLQALADRNQGCRSCDHQRFPASIRQVARGIAGGRRSTSTCSCRMAGRIAFLFRGLSRF